MNIVKKIIFAGAVTGILGLAVGSAQALTMAQGAAGLAVQPSQGIVSGGALVEKAQFRGRRGGFRGRGFRGRSGFRGRRGIGPGAAVGLGILGLGLGAAIAGSQPAYGHGYRECWWERRPVYNQYGDYMGRRRVQVCN